MTKRAAIYVRVSTDKQTVENQLRELRQIAERRGWHVAEEYHDAGISGAKGRKDRPGLDRMLRDAQRRRFDVVMAWAIDRLGRSLIDLLGTIQTLPAPRLEVRLEVNGDEKAPAMPPAPRLEVDGDEEAPATLLAPRLEVDGDEKAPAITPVPRLEVDGDGKALGW